MRNAWLENLEDYDTYIEPFIGGQAVMFHLLHNHNFERVVALDINAELILCYKILQTDVERSSLNNGSCVIIIPAIMNMRNGNLQGDLLRSVRDDWNASVLKNLTENYHPQEK